MIPALLLTLAAASGAAQPTLTLEEAVKLAKANNLDLKVAKARLKQAHEASWQAWSGYLPHLSAGGAFVHNSYEQKLTLPATWLVREDPTHTYRDTIAPPFDPNNVNKGFPSDYYLYPDQIINTTIQPYNTLAGELDLSQAIIAPALWPAIQAAYKIEKVADLSVDSAQRDILFAVTQVYYGAVGTRQASQVERQLLDSYIAHEKDAKVRVDSGMYPKITLIRAQIDRTKAEQDYLSAQNAYRSMVSSLATLLNRSPDFDVTDPPEIPLPPDMNQTEEASLDARPDVQAARTQTEVSKASQMSSILTYLPNVGFSAKAQKTNVASLFGPSQYWSITFGLNWTLFDGGLRESNLRTANAKVVEADLQRESSEARVRDEIRRARLNLESAQANRVKAEDQVRLAREGAQLVKVNFDAGVATYLEVADANLALSSAELNAVGQRLNAQLSLLQLAKAQGAFNPQ
jgi:outer membrane protein TolC